MTFEFRFFLVKITPNLLLVVLVASGFMPSHVYATTEADRNLLMAARSGDIPKVKESLNAGANVNVRDDKGQTPLILASTQGHTSLAALLLEKGADPNEKTLNGNTALMLAAVNNYTDLVTLLLQRKADVNSLR